VAKSDLELQRFHLAQAMRGLVAPATRALAYASRRGVLGRRDMLWSLGSLIEAGGFLCLGVDLGYLPRTDTADALGRLFARQPAAELTEEELALIVGNAWAEHLAHGDAGEALAVRGFADLPKETPALLPAFQWAWSFAARLAASAAANRFLRLLLLADDEAWRGEMHDKGIGLLAILMGPSDEQVWRELAAEHPIDGLLDTLRHLEILSEWAESANAAARRRGRRPGLRFADEESATTAARILVRSLGKLLRWRLDLANQLVGRRLGLAIDDADGLLGNLLKAAGGSTTEIWPEGFRAAATKVLADWEEISGGTTRILPKPSGGGPAAAAGRTETTSTAAGQHPDFQGTQHLP
jgi:hypothetical protein